MYSVKRGDEAALSPLDQLKVDLHRRLISRLDLDALERIKSEAELTSQIRQAVLEFIREEATPLNQREREQIVEQVIDEVTGLGPIEPLFRDRTITDIMVNGAHQIYVERFGKLELASTRPSATTRTCSRSSTASSAASAAASTSRRPWPTPVCPTAPASTPSSRRWPSTGRCSRSAASAARARARHGAEQTLTPEMLASSSRCVKARLNCLISGGTGTGKTTMHERAVLVHPRGHERVITIEDAAELQLQQRHVVRLETRPPNAEGRGEVLARDLVKNALRMRPDRIVIGESVGARRSTCSRP